MIKVILALQAGELPGQPHFATPNPHIPWERLPVEVVRARRAWPEGRRIAGVSSFGFSGTNAHVVVEGYAAAAASETTQPALPERSVFVLPLSAKSDGALTAMAERYVEWLADPAQADVAPGDVCFTAGAGRSHFGHRAAVVAADRAELLAGVSALAAGEAHPSVHVGQRRGSAPARVGVLFTGQGSQWAGMGQGLYGSEPVFRDMVDRCAAAVGGLGLHAHPLLEVMFAGPDSELARLLDDTLYARCWVTAWASMPRPMRPGCLIWRPARVWWRGAGR